MGMYDTIYFDKPYRCPACNELINHDQVKEFENLLEEFHTKDVVSHAEDIRIIKNELFCDNCSKFTGKNIYIVVNRGIFIGTSETLEEAKTLLNDLNLEKLILWYHDLYERYDKANHKKNSHKKFLSVVRDWYKEKLYEKSTTGVSELYFIEHSRYFENTKDPIEAIERYLSYDSMINALNDLWEEGHETLDIYYPEEINVGDEKWYADIYQDDINELCDTNWTWTVISKKEVEESGEKVDDLSDFDILVEEPFSEQVILDSVDKWLKDRGFEFKVRLIPMEEARGSGSIKELKERLKNLDKEKFIKLDDLRDLDII
jgi:hypothetical protein